MAMFMQPEQQSKTRRREVRQRIRNRLMASSDPPPSLAATVNVARDLDELLKKTSGGALRVAVMDPRTQEPVAQHVLSEMVEAWRESF